MPLISARLEAGRSFTAKEREGKKNKNLHFGSNLTVQLAGQHCEAKMRLEIKSVYVILIV